MYFGYIMEISHSFSSFIVLNIFFVLSMLFLLKILNFASNLHVLFSKRYSVDWEGYCLTVNDTTAAVLQVARIHFSLGVQTLAYLAHIISTGLLVYVIVSTRSCAMALDDRLNFYVTER